MFLFLDIMGLIWYHYCGDGKNMKLITRNTDYAVRALRFIAGKKGRVVPVPELVGKLKIPRPFLRKILQRLNREGILKSRKGLGGGFCLARPADRIYLSELIKILQGPVKLNECIFKKKICPDQKKCPLRKKISEVENTAVRKLQAITLAELL